MKYTEKEVIQYVREEDIKFIRLAFCDVFGNHKNMAIMPYELERAFRYGIPIDPTSIEGFSHDGSTTLLLKPDPSTLKRLPWRPDTGGVVRMFCSIHHLDGSSFDGDLRSLLKEAMEKAEAKGIHFKFGTSMEFYLFKTDEDGKPTMIPQDEAGYMDIGPADKGENVRREIQLAMELMGVQPESSHHECGPGQNEIDFVRDDPLISADNAIIFKYVVSAISGTLGLVADFSPKPMLEHPGSGMHISITVDTDDGIDHLEQVTAGIMEKIGEMTLFLDPVENSYERLGQFKAPRYISWSQGDKSHLIRIRHIPGVPHMAELRSLDAKTNPYLAFTLLIHAGLYGIEHKLTLPPCSNINLFEAPQSEISKFRSLPASLKEASKAARKSDFVNSVIPSSILDDYCLKAGK